MTITAQLGLAFPDVPGFKGQGWSTQETAMVVRWLFATPAAWDRAMDTARAYPENPHTVADTLHEHIVPRSELDAIVTAGGDPARVNWLEVAHELIERRGDPKPAAVSLAAQAAAEPPDGPPAALVTARHLRDTSRHLAAASGHLDAAREAKAGDPDDRIGQCATSLDAAHASAHKLAAHLRDSYPSEGVELDKLTGTIGLAVSVSDQAKTATTAHLTQTICNHLGHTIAHVKAMGDDPDPEVRKFNWEHARTHMDGAIEHAGKLTHHLRDNYPDEAGHLAALAGSGKPAADLATPRGWGSWPPDWLPGTISVQLAEPASIAGQALVAGRPKEGTITGQVDLAGGWRAEPRDLHGRWTRAAGVATITRQAGIGRVGHDSSLVADAREASPEEFASAFGKAFAGSPFSAFVNHYSPAEIRAGHMTPVLAAGGKAGVLIHPHGDGRVEPTALFNTSGQRGMGLALGRLAIDKYGANYAECFGPALPKMYATLGYANGAVYPFDPAEAPPGWDAVKFDSPDYHTMNLATQDRQAIAAANEDDGMDLDEIREQSGCTDEEWQAALAVFGIEPPAAPPAEA